MLPPALFHSNRADSLIMTYSTCTAYWMVHDAMPKIGDPPLTLTVITSNQPLYTQLLYATDSIDSFDIHYCVCMYYRLHR